jgi:hypothetical protein
MHRSFNNSKVLSVICCNKSSLMDPWIHRYNINAESSFVIWCVENCINTPIPTWFQTKLFTPQLPTSQPLQSNASFAIRHKNIMISMLVLIPVINQNKRYVNCVCPFFTFAQWTQWHTVMVHTLFSQYFYWVMADTIMDVVFRWVNIFLLFVSQIACSNFWLDRIFEVIAQIWFHVTSRRNSHTFHMLLFLWYPNIRTYILLYSGTDIKQTARTRIFLIPEEMSVSIR